MGKNGPRWGRALVIGVDAEGSEFERLRIQHRIGETFIKQKGLTTGPNIRSKLANIILSTSQSALKNHLGNRSDVMRLTAGVLAFAITGR